MLDIYLKKCLSLYNCLPDNKTTMIPQQSQAKKSKKDLLKLQRPIYELKRSEEGRPEAIIAKLMEQKQKPQIGFLPRSQLFEQLDKFIPVLKQSNQQLLKTEIKPEMQFDAKLEQVEDSSSSSDEEQNGAEMQNEGERMEAQPKQAQFLESVEQFQFNILKYPYLPKEDPSAQTKVEQKQSLHQIVSQSLAGQFQRIVEVNEKGETIQGGNHLEQLQ